MEHSDSKNDQQPMNRRKSDHLSTIAKIVSDVRFMLPMLIVMTGGTAYNFEAVRTVVNGSKTAPLPELPGEIAKPVQPGVHPEVRQKLEAIIKKLDTMDRRDAAMRRDISKLQELVQ